ncbi:endocuticle structural glycoprotein SgAbd-1-like [Venturia canescens]|uniref:endocuticle structural glycoprotein SgAbd-1-like n=1 Tax=Venturia canescens TaxID=32260 RepID=UPI001C9BE662|nr:endocuticle structural glycoprotein SgAbd-1-like [Venturia canescens]
MSIPKISVFMAMAIVAIYGAPLDNSEPIAILRQSQDGPNSDGSYSWIYETANGIQAQEEGSLVASKQSNEDALSAKGSYSYTSDDGTPIQISYTANEDGFQPQGVHLPTSPPIPAAIIKALEWIAAHPEEDNL